MAMIGPNSHSRTEYSVCSVPERRTKYGMSHHSESTVISQQCGVRQSAMALGHIGNKHKIKIVSEFIVLFVLKESGLIRIAVCEVHPRTLPTRTPHHDYQCQLIFLCTPQLRTETVNCNLNYSVYVESGASGTYLHGVHMYCTRLDNLLLSIQTCVDPSSSSRL